MDVQRGKEHSFEQLSAEFAPLINSILQGFDLENGDFKISKEDLYQEGVLGLYDACMRYNDDKKCKFSTFAYVVIKRRITKQYYHMLAPYKKEGLSVDRFESVDYIKSYTPSYVSEGEMAYVVSKDTDLNEYSKVGFLSKEDQDIIKMRLQNYSYKEIASALNIKEKKVDNTLAKIRKKYSILVDS